MSVQLNPYINFKSDAAEAIKMYESALGAKVENIMYWKDAPGDIPEDLKNRVMHCALRIGGNLLMLSDAPPNMPDNGHHGYGIAMQFDDAAAMSKAFDALAVGGKVTMPVSDAFWGSKFGMLTDKFGVEWMFNCPQK